MGNRYCRPIRQSRQRALLDEICGSKFSGRWKKYFFALMILSASYLKFQFFWLNGSEMVWVETNFFIFIFWPPKWPKWAQNRSKWPIFTTFFKFWFFERPYMGVRQRNLQQKLEKWPNFTKKWSKIFVWGGPFFAKWPFTSDFSIFLGFFHNNGPKVPQNDSPPEIIWYIQQANIWGSMKKYVSYIISMSKGAFLGP